MKVPEAYERKAPRWVAGPSTIRAGAVVGSDNGGSDEINARAAVRVL